MTNGIYVLALCCLEIKEVMSLTVMVRRRYVVSIGCLRVAASEELTAIRTRAIFP